MSTQPSGALLMSATAETQDSILAELSALNAHFIQSFVTGDAVAHAKILHPEFISVTAYGRHSRDQYLTIWPEAFKAAEVPYFDHRDEMITVIGDLALVRAANKRGFRA